ncbi:hypothetical protein QR685DRAFT_440337, partial [Neurospora intermedia]
KSPISNYIYITVNARSFQEGNLIKTYINPNTKRTLIGRRFPKILEYTIEIKYTKVKGVGRKSVNIPE